MSFHCLAVCSIMPQSWGNRISGILIHYLFIYSATFFCSWCNLRLLTSFFYHAKFDWVYFRFRVFRINFYYFLVWLNLFGYWCIRILSILRWLRISTGSGDVESEVCFTTCNDDFSMGIFLNITFINIWTGKLLPRY